MTRLCLASHNQGKLREFRALLEPIGFELTSMAELNLPEAEEPHVTFVENALAKARHASRLSGLPALADDSGLCVRALNGAPGVYSARYAGEPKSDTRNNEKLLTELADKSDRHAWYTCVLVWVNEPNDPQPIIAEGLWHGEILGATQGEGGFGYDPLFWLPNFKQSAAELDAAQKNGISHRGLALQDLLHKLAQRKA